MRDAKILNAFRLTRALKSRSFALLWIGQTISRMGDFAFTTALAWQTLLLTHSGTAMGLVLVAFSIPQLIFLLIGGVAADRLPKLRVLLCSDTGRAVAVLVIALLSALHQLQLWHLISLSFIFGIAQGFFFPAFQSLPTQLVEAEMLPSANSLNSLSQQAGILVGPLLGAALIGVAGPALAFAFDGITFILSALCILFARVSPRLLPMVTGKTDQSQSTSQQGLQKILFDMRDGLGYIIRSPWLWVSIVISSLANVAIAGSLQVAFPRLVKDFYHAGVWLLGAYGPSEAIGSLLGIFLIGMVPRLRHRGVVNYLSLVIGSSGVALMGLPLLSRSPLFAVIGGGVLIGVGFSISGVIWVTVLQELVPIEKQGRVFSIDALGSLGLQPVGYALLGIATDRFGPASIFLVGGLFNVLLSLLALCVRGVHEID